MSTIKVDTYLTRGGASEIAIDKLKGASSAGSMTVVGEGGSTTTNLQQGLCKHWISVDMSSAAVLDSFNAGSITDNGTGDYTTNITNAMGNANFCYTALGGDTSGSLSVRIENASNRTTTTIDLISYNTSNAALDIQDVNSLFHGDLA